jgi:hypothetical protein
MEINYYEVPNKNCTYGDEKLLTKTLSDVVPRVGELVGFEQFGESYRVLDVSYWNSYPERGYKCSVEILVYVV